MKRIDEAIQLVRTQMGRVAEALDDIRVNVLPKNPILYGIMADSYESLLEDLRADMQKWQDQKAALAAEEPVAAEAN